MHFIFIATNKNRKLYRRDPSFIYRCQNIAKGLEKNGHTTELIHIKDLHPFKKGDVFIFHRPSFSIRLWLLIKMLSVRNLFIMMDVDDFIFDANYASESPAYINKILPLQKVKKQFQKNLKAFKLFSHFSVSTSPLQSHLKRLIPHADTVVIPNSVYEDWKTLPKQTKRVNQKVISYFPGTRSHDKDFLTIQKPLEKFLNTYPDIILKITGQLNFHLNVPNHQIQYRQRVDFSEHWKNYQDVWVNLAPLEKTHFNHCKSALKVIEAGYFNIPTMTIDNDDTRRFKDAGAIIVSNQEEFFHQLESLLDEKEYQNKSHQLQEKVLKKADVVEVSKQLIHFIEKRIPLKAALDRRARGIYTLETLKLYYQAFQQTSDPKIYLEYCIFCRDLGYRLSSARYKKLKTNLLLNRRARPLIDEFHGRFSKKSPFLQTVFQKQTEWFQEFQAYIHNKTVCIVGNSAITKGKNLGNLIDKHDIVIRFNHCCQPQYKDDLGEKIDIWVSAPNIDSVIPAQWIIITGPNMLYKNAKWGRFQSVDLDQTRILTTPLPLWREMVKILHAPPSAGILLIYWIYTLRNSFKKIDIIGFDLESASKQYHYIDAKHQPSSRHNWQREKEVIKEWITQGLNVLDRDKR
ncbi:MAG: hypothetical protein DSY46_02625 [Hydrogenimonas sp.]|nr:MAG: hypothetical protein DSY46_02625 [Hydrogenimonas sp.]